MVVANIVALLVADTVLTILTVAYFIFVSFCLKAINIKRRGTRKRIPHSGRCFTELITRGELLLIARTIGSRKHYGDAIRHSAI